jgi:drug/metabolite transporter (DMT)-like permease
MVGLVAGATVTAGGFFAFQRGLQSGPATGVVTLMTAGTNVVAILGGLLVMRESLGATPALAALHAGSFALVVLAGLLAAGELTRLAEPAAVRGTSMPAAPPRRCSVVPGRAG